MKWSWLVLKRGLIEQEKKLETEKKEEIRQT